MFTFGLLNGQSLIDVIIGILLSIPAVILAITFHEAAHGYAAYKCGDNTARMMGRLTLNPKAHFDLFGALSMLFVGFGWATPVPINPYNFRKRKAGIIIVSLAGPFANLILAAFSYLLFGVVMICSVMATNDVLIRFIEIFMQMLYLIYTYNISLMVFNLLPIPPLDGSKVLFSVLPSRAHNFVLKFERYGMLILVVLLFTGILDYPINFFVNLVASGLDFCMMPLFRLITGLVI